MNPYPLLFSNVRPTQLRGADVFSFEWASRTARLACDAADWPTALDRLVKLTTHASGDSAAHMAIVGLAMCACADGHLAGRVEGVLGLLGPAETGVLEILKPAVQHLSDVPSHAAEMLLIGLSNRFPAWPWASTSLALRLEREERWDLAFEAWKKAESVLPEARLRAGVAALHAGRMSAGRDRLRGLPWEPDSLAWVALAWTQSSGRFDRFRGYDILEDTLRAERRAEPGLRPPLGALQDVCRAVVNRTRPLLDEDEFARLSDLVQLAFDPLEAAGLGTQLRARLEADSGTGSEARVAQLTLRMLEGETPTDHPLTPMVVRARSGELSPADIHALLQKPPATWPEIWAVWLNLKPVDELPAGFVSLFETWVAEVRRPTCGWLRVAEYLHAQKHHALAVVALDAALNHEEVEPRPLLESVCEHSVAYLARQGSEATLHMWLKRIQGL